MSEAYRKLSTMAAKRGMMVSEWSAQDIGGMLVMSAVFTPLAGRGARVKEQLNIRQGAERRVVGQG